MTPNDTHRELLLALPREVRERLREVGPGWALCDSPALLSEAPARLSEGEHDWLCQANRDNFKAAVAKGKWPPVGMPPCGCDDLRELGEALWLPCDPGQIVACVPMLAFEGRAALVLTKPGEDAHVAALRMLAACCGVTS